MTSHSNANVTASMRIMDAISTLQLQRALQGIALTSRSCNENSALQLLHFFLHASQHTSIERDFLIARRTSMLRICFPLDEIDDRQCLERFRFKKPDVQRIVAELNWAVSTNSTKLRRYSTNVM